MYRINKKILISIPFAIIILLAGCESIPPGTAPDGSIVNFSSVSNRKPVDAKTATNTMITSLITSPVISSADKTPSVFFKAAPFDMSDNNSSAENYSSKFNKYALTVYKNLLYSNLINAPGSIDSYDYNLISNYRENYIIKSDKKGEVFQWTLGLYSTKNTNRSVWNYSVNIIIPPKEKKTDIQDV
jgi:hypothetical protein